MRHLLLSITGLGLFLGLSSLPVNAGELTRWKFDANQNRLDFQTNQGVQPKAVMIFNPTRLVIDLPGIEFGKKTIYEKLNGKFSTLRVGKFDEQTTRIVLEVQQGYTLNPNYVQFTGNDPINWFVNLPTPEPMAATPIAPPPPPTKPTL